MARAPKLPPAAKPDKDAKVTGGLRPDGDFMVGTFQVDGWTFEARWRDGGRLNIHVTHPPGVEVDLGDVWAGPRGADR